ncbi:MAG: stage II sporulation protein P [Firmicutes bacterium]|nr:stage II sporulation protein P [Bacillota bacterium]
MRRFKTKKRKKYLKLFVWLFIFVLFIQIFILPFKNYEIKKSNESFVLKLINGTNHYLETNHDKIFTNVVNKILNVDFSKPVSLVSKSFDYNEEETVFMVNIDSTIKEIDNNVTNPRVYIYSSHQSEGYNNEYDVVKASVKLKEALEKFKINTIVEEGNIIEFMRVNNYIHAYSYIASRYFIEPVIKKNNFDLIIDLHRDSNSKESSTVTIDGKNFAKVLFVVGLENENYEPNLKLTEKLQNMISKKYPTLSRGIYKKQGQGVDGVYNQDINSKMILLELGGYQNTMSEVNNTIDLIASIIKEYIDSL